MSKDKKGIDEKEKRPKFERLLKIIEIVSLLLAFRAYIIELQSTFQ